jgi:dATP pyrophosphohydrolase
LVILDSVASIPVLNVVGKFLWGDKVLIIPEYCFGVEVKGRQLNISREHIEYKWVNYEEAVKMLKWDSNKSALWELNERLLRSKRNKS